MKIYVDKKPKICGDCLFYTLFNVDYSRKNKTVYETNAPKVRKGCILLNTYIAPSYEGKCTIDNCPLVEIIVEVKG